MPIFGIKLIWPHTAFFEADFRNLAPGAFTGTLPGGLSFTRALNNKGTSETVQTSDTTVATSGMTANVPRIGQYGPDFTTRGILCDPSTGTNALDSRNPNTGMQAGTGVTTTLNFTTGPDGGGNAWRWQINNGGNSQWEGGFSAQGLAFWAKLPSGSQTINSQMRNGGGTFDKSVNTVLNTTWQKVTCWLAKGTTGTFAMPVNMGGFSGGVAGPVDMHADLMEILGGSSFFPTEATLGSGCTRAVERLFHSNAGAIVNANRISLEVRTRPRGASNNYPSNMRIWSKDSANYYAEFDATTQRINVVVNGVSFSPATTLTWAEKDIVDFWIEAGGGTLNTKIVYRVNEGTPIVVGTSGSPQAAIPITGIVDFFCDTNGGGGAATKQFAGWHQYIRAYYSGTKPSWVA